QMPVLPEWCLTPGPGSPDVFINVASSRNGKICLGDGRAYWKLGNKTRCDPNDKNQPQIELKGELVSRIHAMILRDERGGVWIRDEGSSHGTWIGTERLKPNVAVKLNASSKLKFGDYPLRGDSMTVTIMPLQLPKAKGEKRPREEVEEEAE
ncbi:unnamed protein product, partial [Polarella glacialis]